MNRSSSQRDNLKEVQDDLAREAQTFSPSSLLSLQKIFPSERSDDRKYVCASKAKDDQSLPNLEEPLPECSLSFTHGIGNQVSNSI